jgi:hypothetical protein
MPTLVGISKNRMLPQMAILFFSMPQFLLFLSWKNKKKNCCRLLCSVKALPYTFLASLCRGTYKSRVGKPQHILCIKTNMVVSVCVDKNWAVPGRFFQSLPVPIYKFTMSVCDGVLAGGGGRGQ